MTVVRGPHRPTILVPNGGLRGGGVADALSHVSERNATWRSAHEHREVAGLEAPASKTDGIEATSVRMGSMFPYGVLVVMNSDGRNFLVLPWPAELM